MTEPERTAYLMGFEEAKAAAQRIIDFAKIAACVERQMSGNDKCIKLAGAIEFELYRLEPTENE